MRLPHHRINKLLRIALGTTLLLAGIGHLSFARRTFSAQVPDWVPLTKDATVVFSGYVEILLGLSLLCLPRRKAETVATFTALFFIAVFPGNWSQYIHHRDGFGLDTDEKRLARLFMQPFLVYWALRAGNVNHNSRQLTTANSGQS